MKRGEKLQRALEDEPDEDELADLALRYDLTVPLARIFAEHSGEFPRYLKRYQIQPVWRADRPQKGRYREFYQCDVDVVGSESLMVEAEVASALTEVLHQLGFEDFRIHTNHRKLLTALMETAGIDQELRSEALIAIDKLDKIGTDGVVDELEQRGIARENIDALMPLLEKGATADSPPFDNETTLDRLSKDVGVNEAGQQAIADLRALLAFTEEGPASDHLFVDPYLARGLSYYTGTIFEIQSDDFSGSLGGGGRYDELIGMFSNQSVPACGFSLGVERILVLMEEREMFAESAPGADVLVTLWNEQFASKTTALARELREAGLRVDVYPDHDDGFGKQFGYANERDIPFVAILAPDELDDGVVSIKDMESGDQEEIDRDNVASEVAAKVLTHRDE
jgi:histidyl-tRNA synthetase